MAEKPKIELYMYSLNQEFPAGKGHHSFLKRYSELKEDVSGKMITNAAAESQVFLTRDAAKKFSVRVPDDWSAQWVSNEWIENHVKAAGVGIIDDINPWRRAILRKEDFGGILFDPQSDRVFKLNEPGVRLYSAMRDQSEVEGAKINLKAAAQQADVDADAADDFVGYLKAAGLWNEE